MLSAHERESEAKESDRAWASEPSELNPNFWCALFIRFFFVSLFYNTRMMTCIKVCYLYKYSHVKYVIQRFYACTYCIMIVFVFFFFFCSSEWLASIEITVQCSVNWFTIKPISSLALSLSFSLAKINRESEFTHQNAAFSQKCSNLALFQWFRFESLPYKNCHEYKNCIKSKSQFVPIFLLLLLKIDFCCQFGW